MSGSDAVAVAAAGSDPELLVALVAAIADPAVGPGALRRACRDAPSGTAGRSLTAQVSAVVPDVTPAGRARAAAALGRWATAGVRVAVVGDPAYPADLAEGWPHLDVPVLLAWRGAPPAVVGPGVAIVGSRRATGYGAGIADWLAADVARAGVRVVSGGARGIDAAAHRAAMGEVGGTTVVLGCGHAVDYPRAHARPGGLFDLLVEAGGTLASPFLPDVEPRAFVLRSRNAVVAGLARAVVVVEGDGRSGSLLTASAAADRGRPVLAVPGDVRAPLSVAPHRLLAEGAAPCTGPLDVLAALGVAVHDVPASVGSGGTGSLPTAVRVALAAAWPRPLALDDLALRCGVPAADLLAALTRARVLGEVADGPDGMRLASRPASRPTDR